MKNDKDALGTRMKDIEHRTRYLLPRRTYTLIRLDGKAFHTFTKHCERPFDVNLRRTMQEVTRLLCANIQGCKLGYTQSDEITLVLTDFDTIDTCAWFDGNLQKIASVSASMAGGYFNKLWLKHKVATSEVSSVEGVLAVMGHYEPAVFDSRVWTTSDPWEVFNAFWWRQKDATKNAIQMVARSLASHKECHDKNFSMLNELIHQKGQNFNDYPTDCKRGAFIIKDENGWVVDLESPILTKDKPYLMSRIPYIPQYDASKYEIEEEV